jgi:5-amino-6-(5-phospho-D-ribitylamino)uracil phosphatase
MYKPLPDYRIFDIEKAILPFSKIRLVALDLDGTLLRACDSTLHKKIIEFARKLNVPKHDVRMTIATGRTLTGARPLLEMLPIRANTPIILYNGNVIVNKKYEVLFRAIVTSASLTKIVKLVSNFDVQMLAYTYEWFRDDEPAEFAVGWSSLDRPEREYNKMPVIWKGWNDKVDFCPSAIVIHTQGDPLVTTVLSRELEKIEDIYITHGNTYIEIGPRDSNKGKALQFAASALGLIREEVLAIGDNDNDAEMLSWAGVGVAVESASALAMNHSDFITKRGVINGAIEVMKLVHSARRLLK